MTMSDVWKYYPCYQWIYQPPENDSQAKEESDENKDTKPPKGLAAKRTAL